ncbi:molecular chaperone [Parerythrobacter jejuensis]
MRIRLFGKAFSTILLFVTAAVGLQSAPAVAQGDLLVAPTRVILDGRRGGEVILSNIGSEEATYRIGLELRRMDGNGNLSEISREDANTLEQAALSMVRYAPRRIVLPPGQPQSVRISARPPAELPDGEYRAHLSFRAIPKPKRLDPTAPEAQGLVIDIQAIYGVTIPLIIRKGKVESGATLAKPQIFEDPRGGLIGLVLNREGTGSTYGALHVKVPGEDKPITLAAGVALYPEIDQRVVSIPVSAEQLASMRGRGPVTIEYRELPENGGELIASVEADLG